MAYRIILATTLLLMALPSIGEDISMETYLRHATKREFDGLYVAYVVTALRSSDLELKLPEKLKNMCHENEHLDKYKISIYANLDSADFARNNIGTLPNLTDQQWQKAERALLATFNPYDGTLMIRAQEQQSGDSPSKKIHLGTAWCQK